MLSLNRFLRIRFMQINSEQSEIALKSLFPFVGKALLSDVCLISSTRVQKAVCLIWVGSPGPQSSLFLNGLPLCHQEWPLAPPAPGQDRFSSTIILCLITMHPSSLFCLGNSSFYSTPVILTENAMAPHSSTLAWKIPWMEEPGRLRSMGLLRVGHDWATSLSLFTFTHWRRKWQPTPVFLPGKSQGWWSLVGCHLWGCTESDTAEVT